MTLVMSIGAFYKAYLEPRWAEGYQSGSGLFKEIKRLGYTGCFSYLARLPSPWRDKTKSSKGTVASPGEVATRTKSGSASIRVIVVQIEGGAGDWAGVA